MKPTWIIDRIEGEQAVLEPIDGGPHFTCPVAWLPEDVDEGDAVRLVPVPRSRGAAKGPALRLPDGKVIGPGADALPPGLGPRASVAFVEAPEIEAERRRSVAERLARLAEDIEDDFSL